MAGFHPGVTAVGYIHHSALLTYTSQSYTATFLDLPGAGIRGHQAVIGIQQCIYHVNSNMPARPLDHNVIC